MPSTWEVPKSCFLGENAIGGKEQHYDMWYDDSTYTHEYVINHHDLCQGCPEIAVVQVPTLGLRPSSESLYSFAPLKEDKTFNLTPRTRQRQTVNVLWQIFFLVA